MCSSDKVARQRGEIICKDLISYGSKDTIDLPV